MLKRKFGTNTICTHSGAVEDVLYGGAVSPLYFSTSYPFIELSLGIIFLTQTQSILIYANAFTLIFMVSQTIGIIRSLSKSEQIQCACMGSAVDVPLSSLTVVENITMIAMATYMIIQFL